MTSKVKLRGAAPIRWNILIIRKEEMVLAAIFFVIIEARLLKLVLI